jgi:spore coat protein A
MLAEVHPMRSSPLLARVLGIVLLLAPMAFSARADVQTPLDPTTVPRFVEPLPLPGALNGAATSAASPLVISMSEFQQKLLPASFYSALPTPYAAGAYVWGYNGTYPGPTIVARRGVPTHVKYINNLFNPNGGPLYLQSNIHVDQTIHWADPLGTHGGSEAYTGPVPVCVHLHGGEVPSAFDGGPNAWWTPGFAQKGSGFVADQYVYPNQQEATTMFYHDHALGMTRINVYSGLAGFYLLLDPTSEPANLPGGSADRAADIYGQPFQVGMAFQDRMFDTNGQLYFPSEGINPEHPFWVPEFFGDVMLVNGRSWPYMRVEPRRYRFRWVDGSNARFYQLSLVDAATGAPGPMFWQIGSDGGLLNKPVGLNNPRSTTPQVFLMAPGERADIIIDFSNFAGKTLTMVNIARAPFPSGDAPDPATIGQIMQFRVGPRTSRTTDRSWDPAHDEHLRTHEIERPDVPRITRALTLNEVAGDGGPLGMFMNNTMWDMTATENLKVGDTEVWEFINLTMDTHPNHLHLFQYQLVNRQAFDVNRYMAVYGTPQPGSGPPLPYSLRNKATGGKLGGNPDVTPFLVGSPIPPDANERGWKDTFRMNPGQVGRVLVRVAPQDAIARAKAAGKRVAPGVNLYPFEPWAAMGTTDSFGYPGGPGYVWHCHIVDHEDNEMMRPLFVTGPAPAAMLAQAMPAAAEPATATQPTLRFELAQSRPNPALGRTSISFTLPRESIVDLRVFDVTGHEVTALATGTFGPGSHSIDWNGEDRDGRAVAPGAYFYRLRAGQDSQVRKLLFLR